MILPSNTVNPAWQPIEQPAGPPLIASTVDPRKIDDHRKEVYQSCEAFLRNRLRMFDQGREKEWNRNYSSVGAYLRSVEPMRTRLKEMLGFWIEPEQRPSVVRLEEEVLLEEDDFTAKRFYFEIFPGLNTYAVELIPNAPVPGLGLILQHGYSGTPELICGLTSTANAEDYAYRSLGIRAVRRGFHVMAVHHPSGYGTGSDTMRGLPQFTDYPPQYGKNRLHRMAIMAGGTLFGLDMMGSSRGVDLLMQSPGVDPKRICMYGLSQGGQSAAYLPALDRRVMASVASAWFNRRFLKLIGGTRATCYLDSLEEDKFFTDSIRLFSDSDVASLICPRAFAVEAGLNDSSVDFELAQNEFKEAHRHYKQLGVPDQMEFIPHRQGHIPATARAIEFLVERTSECFS